MLINEDSRGKVKFKDKKSKILLKQRKQLFDKHETKDEYLMKKEIRILRSCLERYCEQSF